MQEELQEKRTLPQALKTLTAVIIGFLALAALYVFYQAGQVLFPPNTYETALLATVEDTVDAQGVLLFSESYVAGDGTLGYLVDDGERVSAGTAVAEVYSDASQAGLRQQLTQNQRSQSGLDLGVIDHYNGTRRSVKTLSGGESFKASLALALGLSNEVQSTAGGIRLDTLFLDEGFGSLDDESLEQAIRVLSGLTEGDRLVGIISHVAALKDRIDRQVLVKKALTGGSTVELVV